jgi:isopentenyldiphosphate isomerase
VHVFLVNPQGKLLVQQRSRQRKLFPLAMDCSVSEHVKAGENYRQAARRGISEELGIQPGRLNALVKFSMIYGVNDLETSILYEGMLGSPQMKFDPQEVEQIAFFNLAELEEMINSKEYLFSRWFVQLISWYLRKPSELNIIRTYTDLRLLSNCRASE